MQSYVCIRQVTRFLESVFPITSLAEEIELYHIYIFSRLYVVFCRLFSIQHCRAVRDTIAGFSIFSGIRPTRPPPLLPSGSRYFRVLAQPLKLQYLLLSKINDDYKTFNKTVKLKNFNEIKHKNCKTIDYCNRNSVFGSIDKDYCCASLTLPLPNG